MTASTPKYTINQTVELCGTPACRGQIHEVWKNANHDGEYYYWVTWATLSLSNWYWEEHLQLVPTTDGSLTPLHGERTVFDGMEGVYYAARVSPIVISLTRERAKELIAALPHHSQAAPSLKDLHLLLTQVCAVDEEMPS